MRAGPSRVRSYHHTRRVLLGLVVGFEQKKNEFMSNSLFADDDAPVVLPPLDRAAVDAGAHGVCVRIETIAVCLSRSAVFAGHLRRVRVVRDAHAVAAIVRFSSSSHARTGAGVLGAAR